MFDDAATFQAAYGTSREDTRSVCGDANNGFGLLFNWNLLGSGTHTVHALADGIEFGRATFTVTTLGTDFLRGAGGRHRLLDFPQAGTDVIVRWQESTQNFVIEAVEESMAYPDIRDVYEIVSLSETHTGCLRPGNNGTISFDGTVNVDSQNGGSFSGTIFNNLGPETTATSVMNGTVTVDGQVSGTFTTDAFTDGEFVARSESTFTGAVTGNVLTVTYSGRFVVGERCSITGSFSAVR